MSTVESPCISVCRMDKVGDYCTGCWRTRDELRAWKLASDDLRRDILTKSNGRREAAGGRARRVSKRQALKS